MYFFCRDENAAPMSSPTLLNGISWSVVDGPDLPAGAAPAPPGGSLSPLPARPRWRPDRDNLRDRSGDRIRNVRTGIEPGDDEQANLLSWMIPRETFHLHPALVRDEDKPPCRRLVRPSSGGGRFHFKVARTLRLAAANLPSERAPNPAGLQRQGLRQLPQSDLDRLAVVAPADRTQPGRPGHGVGRDARLRRRFAQLYAGCDRHRRAY
jgi:hypothetical protein